MLEVCNKGLDCLTFSFEQNPKKLRMKNNYDDSQIGWLCYLCLDKQNARILSFFVFTVQALVFAKFLLMVSKIAAGGLNYFIIKSFILVLCIFTIVNLKKRPVTDSASCGAGSCPLAIVIVPYGLLIVL